MNDTSILHESRNTTANPLAPVVVGLVRALSMERDAHESTRFVLHEAVNMLSEQDRQIDRERTYRLHLLEQYRVVVSDRAAAEARQAIDEAIDKEALEGALRSEHSRAA
jgi:hypothetical protein